MGQCNMQVIDGAHEDWFSVEDVVGVMEVVLGVCQEGGEGGRWGLGGGGLWLGLLGLREGGRRDEGCYVRGYVGLVRGIVVVVGFNQ